MKRVNFECAVVAASAMVWVAYQEMKWEADYGGDASSFPAPKVITVLCFAPICYLAAAVASDIFDRVSDVGKVPAWVTISVLGSLLFSLVFVRQFPFDSLNVARVAFVFSIFTALLTAPIYYSAAIVTLLKRLRRGLASGLKSLRKPK